MYNMDRRKIMVLTSAVLSFICLGCSHQQFKISLAGDWEVRLDSLDVGEAEKW